MMAGNQRGGPDIMSNALIVGGSSGLGRAIAQRAADRGDTVVITSRDKTRAQAVAAEIGGATSGIELDLAYPDTIAPALTEITDVDHVVVCAIEQTANTIADFSIADAIRAVTMKLVGYAEIVRVLLDRFRPDAAVVLFGGLAKERPYPGSTMVTTMNAGVTGLTRTLAKEIAPFRINALHPGMVGDSPKWIDQAATRPAVQRTPIGRLITTAEVVDATEFLLRNGGMNGQDLFIDGGSMLT
jgi:NAD(P)-dependent dehydrogenase (short-subunit alcohol dehydrogenase family)